MKFPRTAAVAAALIACASAATAQNLGNDAKGVGHDVLQTGRGATHIVLDGGRKVGHGVHKAFRGRHRHPHSR